MTEILYALVYIIPMILLGATGIFVRLDFITKPESMAFPIGLMLCIAIILTVIINADTKNRIIISGSILAIILGAVLVTGKDDRNEWLIRNEWIWAAIILSVAVVLLQYLMFKIRIVKITVGGLLIMILISSYQTKLIDSKTGLISTLFLVVTIIFEQIRYSERNDKGITSYVITIIPFLILAAVILAKLPYRNKPYDWALAKKTINRIAEGFTTLSQSFDKKDTADDLEASFGFSENAGAYGSLVNNPEEMMVITVDKDAPEEIYLDGKYFDTFNGRAWSGDEKSYPYMMDTLEAYCATTGLENRDDYRKISRIDITYKKMNTTYAFAPAKSFICDAKTSRSEFIYDDTDIRFARKVGNNTHYSTDYMTINCNDNYMPVLREAGKHIDKELWDDVRKRKKLTGKEYSYDEFLNYKKNLYDSCRTHGEISDKVWEYLDEITKNSTTDYEKLCAIESALSSFEYTTKPGALPNEIDSPAKFMDYFILDTKRGYCNYYATAFVLLSRAEGIPARYVHGYYVSTKGNQTVSVKNNQAHAYPEAYLEGIGWMVFDPTPGHKVHVSWDEKGTFVNQTNPGAFYAKGPLEDAAESDINGEDEEEESSVRWYMIVIPIMLGIMTLILLLLIERLINSVKIKRLDDEAYAKFICLRISRILGHMGYKRADNETIREQVERVNAEEGVNLNDFANIYESVLYSSDMVSKDDIDKLKKEYEILCESLNGRNLIYYKLIKIRYNIF